MFRQMDEIGKNEAECLFGSMSNSDCNEFKLYFTGAILILFFRQIF